MLIKDQRELLMLRGSNPLRVLLTNPTCCYVVSVKHYNSVWSLTLGIPRQLSNPE